MLKSAKYTSGSLSLRERPLKKLFGVNVSEKLSTSGTWKPFALTPINKELNFRSLVLKLAPKFNLNGFRPSSSSDPNLIASLTKALYSCLQFSGLIFFVENLLRARIVRCFHQVYWLHYGFGLVLRLRQNYILHPILIGGCQKTMVTMKLVYKHCRLFGFGLLQTLLLLEDLDHRQNLKALPCS